MKLMILANLFINFLMIIHERVLSTNTKPKSRQNYRNIFEESNLVLTFLIM